MDKFTEKIKDLIIEVAEMGLLEDEDMREMMAEDMANIYAKELKKILNSEK